MNYRKLQGIDKIYFGYEDIAKSLGVTLKSAAISANRYVHQGYLIRAKRNIYVLKERWRTLDKREKFILANLIEVPSYISLMTALDYYGVTTQIQQDFVESIAVKRTKNKEVAGTVFNYVKIDSSLYFGFVRNESFFIATPEKALLDAIYLESLKRYKLDLGSIDFNKIDADKVKLLAKRFPSRAQKLIKELYGYFKKT